MNQPSPENKYPNDADRPQLQLVVHAGPLAGKGFPMVGNILTFGRDDECDITLDDDQVSREHARLIRRGEKVIIEDLDSTNGTMVNGAPVTGQHVLQPSDIISIGASLFGVRGFSAPPTVGTPMSQQETYVPSAEEGPAEGEEPATPTPAPTPSPRPSSSSPTPRRRKKKSSKGLTNATLIMLGGGVGLVITVLIIISAIVYMVSQGYQSATAEIPTVVITAPINNSTVQVNQPVTVQATASDPSGVTRAELLVNGVKVDETISPAPQGQSTLSVAFQWMPEAVGSYNLEVRAYNFQNVPSTPKSVSVNVVGQNGNAEQPAASVTATPTEPTSTEPTLVTLTDLNVRAGPSTEFEPLGLLPPQYSVRITGRDETRQWWQIQFDGAPSGNGWVSGDTTFVRVRNTENVPVVAAPPTLTLTPTPSPTGTPPPTEAPTETPTPTPIPATPTFTPLPPTPTFTPLPPTPETRIDFSVSNTEIEAGECVTLQWDVVGVREIYLQGSGVAGEGEVQDCPAETTTYELRVVKNDNTEEIESRTVEVIGGGGQFSGRLRLRANQTADLDTGISPGDDFIWEVDEEFRQFEALANVEIAPMDIDDLSDLDEDDCEDADYDRYSSMDGSEDPPDDGNAIDRNRGACFITNQGRMGKLYFTDVDDTISLEWILW